MAETENLTTREVADMLHVSSSYVEGLIQAGTLTADATGRLSHAEVLAFRERFDAERKDALDRLTALSQELGLYDE